METDMQRIADEVAAYDARVEMGIVHETGYVIKMEQYRLSLVEPASAG